MRPFLSVVFFSRQSAKLLKETQIVLEQQTDIADFMPCGGQAVKADTKEQTRCKFQGLSQPARTLGCTIPAPSISIHPASLQTRQPCPPHSPQLTSTSTLGPVNGKNDGLKRTLVSPVDFACKLLKHPFEVAHGNPPCPPQVLPPDERPGNGWRQPRRRGTPCRG